MSAARLIPWALHELLEYALGVFLILAPFLFGMLDAPVLPLLIGAGVVLVLLQLLTPGLASIAAVLPARGHATADYLLALALVLSPFVLGFADEQEPLALVVLSGVALLLLALLTRYPVPEATAAAPEAGTSAGTAGTGPTGTGGTGTTGTGAASEGDAGAQDGDAGGAQDDASRHREDPGADR